MKGDFRLSAAFVVNIFLVLCIIAIITIFRIALTEECKATDHAYSLYSQEYGKNSVLQKDIIECSKQITLLEDSMKHLQPTDTLEYNSTIQTRSCSKEGSVRSPTE